jgi:hypothetical protein
MPSSKKPRKAYKRKRNLQDPVGHLLQGMRPVREHTAAMLQVQIGHSAAMNSLMTGGASRYEMDALISMSNIVEALCGMGFGSEYKEESIAGREAIIRIAQRAASIERFAPAGPDIIALNALMDLHDAQMEVIGVADIERAIDTVNAKIARGHTTRLPGISEGVILCD